MRSHPAPHPLRFHNERIGRGESEPMKKIIREVDIERGIVQVTTVDERWYVRDRKNPQTGLPEYIYFPSVTWICSYYPKKPELVKWIAKQGYDEAEQIKRAAGDKGSKVHKAVEFLIDGGKVEMDSKFVNLSTEQDEELTLGEYDCLMSFVQWVKDVKPTLLERETVGWNAKEGYAGTVDCVAQIGEDVYIIDFKTGQTIRPEYELQVSAYKHAYPKYPNAKLAILQIGYRKNGKGYQFTEVEDKYPIFLATKQIWANETSGDKPLQKDYPLMLSLAPEVKAEAPAKAQTEEGKKPKKAKLNENIEGHSETGAHRPQTQAGDPENQG